MQPFLQESPDHLHFWLGVLTFPKGSKPHSGGSNFLIWRCYKGNTQITTAITTAKWEDAGRSVTELKLWNSVQGTRSIFLPGYQCLLATGNCHLASIAGFYQGFIKYPWLNRPHLLLFSSKVKLAKDHLSHTVECLTLKLCRIHNESSHLGNKWIPIRKSHRIWNSVAVTEERGQRYLFLRTCNTESTLSTTVCIWHRWFLEDDWHLVMFSQVRSTKRVTVGHRVTPSSWETLRANANEAGAYPLCIHTTDIFWIKRRNRSFWSGINPALSSQLYLILIVLNGDVSSYKWAKGRSKLKENLKRKTSILILLQEAPRWWRHNGCLLICSKDIHLPKDAPSEVDLEVHTSQLQARLPSGDSRAYNVSAKRMQCWKLLRGGSPHW